MRSAYTTARVAIVTCALGSMAGCVSNRPPPRYGAPAPAYYYGGGPRPYMGHDERFEHEHGRDDRGWRGDHDFDRGRDERSRGGGPDYDRGDQGFRGAPVQQNVVVPQTPNRPDQNPQFQNRGDRNVDRGEQNPQLQNRDDPNQQFQNRSDRNQPMQNGDDHDRGHDHGDHD